MDMEPRIRLRGKHPVLEPTKAADDVARRNKEPAGRLHVAKEPGVVDQEARGRLLAAGARLSEYNVLSSTELQFGQYRGQTFKWLLENAVGWAIGFAKSYHREGVHNVSALGVNKQKLYDYCMASPVIAPAVDFSFRVEDACRRAKETGDDGHRLLEFSDYRDWSWRELFESDKAEHVSFVRNFILPKSDCQTGSKMDQFRRYCVHREELRRSGQAGAVGTTAAMPQSSGLH